MDTSKPLVIGCDPAADCSRYQPAIDFWSVATAKSGGGVWWHLRESFQSANRHMAPLASERAFDAGTQALIALGELVKVKASELPGLFPIYRLRDVGHDPTSFEGDPDYDWDEDEVDIRNDEHLTADQRFALFG